jgi:hypothetical protein
MTFQMLARSTFGFRGWVIRILPCLVLAILVYFETGMVRRNASATYDEMMYVTLAFDMKERDLRQMTEQGVAPLPVVLDAVALGPFAREDMQTYRLRRIITRIRVVHALTTAIPLILGVYFWLLRSRGLLVAFSAALCLALSPTLLGHASLGTTDTVISLWCVATLAALAWHQQRPGLWRLAVVAVALGLAGAAKYSAVCLVPAVLISLGWRRSAAVGAAALLVVWALTGWLSLPLEPTGMTALFGKGAFASRAIPVMQHVKLPSPIVGAVQQWAHQQSGHDAFLLGQSDSGGWWYYMPVTLALKSTPVELVAAAMLPLLIFLAWKRRHPAFTLVCVTLACYSTLLLFNKVDLGVRYALPLFPLAALCVADAIGALGLRRLTLAGMAVAAVTAQATTSIRIAPEYLSYFNQFAGGPENGYRYLGDSNVDWGQDLPALAGQIAQLGGQRVCLAYFGRARPEIYGVNAADWHDPPACGRAQWLALSVTYLQGSYVDNDPFRELLHETPDRRAGFSIFLYRMDRPSVATALEHAYQG